jgi:predicted O-methyltransferase YrrM
MTEQIFNDIYSDELSKGAIINNRHPGFKEDYLVIHCLIRKYKPASLFEIGTNGGFGTKIIKNAIGSGVVFSLDLPKEEFRKVQEYPERIGMECDLPYVQLFGDSLTVDYSKYPAEAYFVDGAHDYDHVFREATAIIKLSPGLIIFHDANIKEVYDGIIDAFIENNIQISYRTSEYDIHHVFDTRIVYATKKER